MATKLALSQVFRWSEKEPAEGIWTSSGSDQFFFCLSEGPIGAIIETLRKKKKQTLKEHYKNVEANAQLHLNFTVQKHWDITCLFVHFCCFIPAFYFRSEYLVSLALLALSFLSGSVVSLFIEYGYASTRFCLYAITLFHPVTYRSQAEDEIERTALYSTLEI